MNYILVDTNKKNFLPITFTRPLSDVRIGIFKIAEKWDKLLGSKVSFLTEEYLSVKFPTRFEKQNVYINSKFLPTSLLIEQIEYLKPNQKLIHGNEWVACCLESNELTVTSSMESFPADTDTILENWWDIFKYNGVEIENDINNLQLANLTQLSPTNTLIGKERKLYIHPSAKVEGVIFNTTYGSIYIDENTEVMEGTTIRGPFALLNEATVKMGAKIYGGTTVGPKCKVGGEIKNVVIQGFTNKSHDGYLGNSVIGEWVNLGANTNCSNLKNTLNEVKVWNYQDKKYISSNEVFIGCCIGDYSKTAINTKLNTGTVIGVNCNVFGENGMGSTKEDSTNLNEAGFPPKYLPNFSWGSNGVEKYQLNKALSVNQKMAELVHYTLTDADEKILSTLHKRQA